MNILDIFQRAVLILVPLVLSLTVHEYAHALSAKLLGDDTAERGGRLTLNPIVHADPIGTVLLPLILVIFNAPFGFGWAKPVPVTPQRFSRKVSMRTGMLIVSAAGPLSNLVMAFISAGAISLLFHTGTLDPEGAVASLLVQLIVLNIALFVFNLIPVYPLDGQKVLTGLLSYDAAIRFERFSARYGTWLLVGVFVLAQRALFLPVSLIYRSMLTIVGL